MSKISRRDILKIAALSALGDLHLEFPSAGEVESYERRLDLDRAVTRVRYRRNGVTYRRRQG